MLFFHAEAQRRGEFLIIEDKRTQMNADEHRYYFVHLTLRLCAFARDKTNYFSVMNDTEMIRLLGE